MWTMYEQQRVRHPSAQPGLIDEESFPFESLTFQLNCIE